MVTKHTEPVIDEQPLMGRRERNKQAKLERILSAASELFSSRGADDVTTQEIAQAADVANGTLFLYAKSKNELLLMVQNAHYRDALTEGLKESERRSDVTDAVMAILEPIIACNRSQPDNGRAYQREILFGEADQPQRQIALAIIKETEDAIAATISRHRNLDQDTAKHMAHLMNGAMTLALAAAGVGDRSVSNRAIAEQIRQALTVVLGR